jgi:DNA primase
MRFSPQFLDELKARLPVSEVVGRRVKLRKAGREWKGLSPFNQEKTPSFFVNDQKQAWFDFSSQKNGSIFDFVMMTEGVSFPEAVERLAAQAGMALPKVSQEDEAREQHRRSLNDVVELAAQFFQATLASRVGARARGYLADRALDPAMQLKFRIGYAPAERFALKEHLGGQGVSVEDMIEAGLLVSGDDIPVPYDRFRDRVMFPITDLRGRVIAFGGRALEKDAQAKYLNSPETPLFHKGGTLFNIAAARAAAHQGAEVIAVEGYVDVIALVSVGYEGSVAPLGTALTADQLTLLWKMADEPILCFDGDGAGRRAAYRAVDLALPLLKPGKSLKFASLPDGQDPDDLVRSGGRQAVADVLGAARPLSQMLWTRETEAGGLDTPERRAAFEARLTEVMGLIGDETVRKYYRRDFGERLRSLFEPEGKGRPFPREAGRGYSPRSAFPPRSGFQPRPGQGGRRPGPGAGRGFASPGFGSQQPYVVMSQQLAAGPLHRGRAAIPRREALILQALVNHPWLAHDHLEELAHIEFRHADTQKLRDLLLDLLAHDGDTSPEALRASLAARSPAELLARVERVITTTNVWGAGPTAAPEDVLMTWKQLVALHRQWHSLVKELKDAEQALGQDTTEANYSWLQDVKARLSAIDGIEATIDGFGTSSGRTARTV